MTEPPELQRRDRALSHSQYLDTLHRPSTTEARRISEIQVQKESDIDRRYHTTEEHDAATSIQRAYRGHRERRQLQGLTLDPSSRWTELIKEWRYRNATAAVQGSMSAEVLHDGRPRASSDVAKLNWRRVNLVAERAGAGEMSSPHEGTRENLGIAGNPQSAESQHEVQSLLMDMRYFLEMVDQKHRYGSNLQVYHEEWRRCKAGQNFFYWLDHGEGKQLDLPGCSRAKLSKERIRYLSREERMSYLVVVDGEGKLRWQKIHEPITTSADQYQDSLGGIVPKEDACSAASRDEEVALRLAEGSSLPEAGFDQGTSDDTSDTDETPDAIAAQQAASKKKKKKTTRHLHVSPATVLNHLLRATVKPGTWIYVADTVGRLFVGIKSAGSFQHTSFLSGARISSAGSIGIKAGQLIFLSPLSGHYRPTTRSFRLFVDSLTQQGVDMSQLKVSKAYEVLLGMEYYDQTKKGIRKYVPGKKVEEGRRSTKPESNEQPTAVIDETSAADVTEQRLQQRHRHKLRDGLHLRRRSTDHRKVAD